MDRTGGLVNKIKIWWRDFLCSAQMTRWAVAALRTNVQTFGVEMRRRTSLSRCRSEKLTFLQQQQQMAHGSSWTRPPCYRNSFNPMQTLHGYWVKKKKKGKKKVPALEVFLWLQSQFTVGGLSGRTLFVKDTAMLWNKATLFLTYTLSGLYQSDSQ